MATLCGNTPESSLAKYGSTSFRHKSCHESASSYSLKSIIVILRLFELCYAPFNNMLQCTIGTLSLYCVLALISMSVVLCECIPALKKPKMEQRESCKIVLFKHIIKNWKQKNLLFIKRALKFTFELNRHRNLIWISHVPVTKMKYNLRLVN